MSPIQHDQIMAALVAQELLVVQAVGSLLILSIGFLTAWVINNTRRIGHAEDKVHGLANGEGDKKITAVINSKIVDGTLNGRSLQAATRSTDLKEVSDEPTNNNNTA